MDLLSAFKRKPPVPAAPEAADAVQRARTRSRQRLIGAAVLVVAGIIGFPLLFETQPRPIPVDLPIEIPRKDNVPPLAMPSAEPEGVAQPAAPASRPTPVSVPTVPTPTPTPTPSERVITETEAEAGREVVASVPRATPPATAPASAVPAEPPPAKAKPVAPPTVVASTATPAAAIKAADGARAQALLEGRPVAAADAPTPAASAARFVVQVGAFSDAAALKEARSKVEKLGLKTYTQVAETPAGPRTRVRVGPFATREEAERAAAKLKAAALSAAILTL